MRAERAQSATTVKKRKDGRPLTLAQQRKAAQGGAAKLPAPKPAPMQLTAAQLQRQADAKRDAALLYENAKKRQLEAAAGGQIPPGTADT